ncbi:MAG: hypothetical protein ACPGYT_12825 [Nitrospirales bacterium]
MNKSSFRVGVVALVAFGLLTFGMTGISLAQKGPAAGNPKAKGDPKDVTKQGKISFKAVQAKSLKGRLYSHWADNPDGEVLFGIQYWNTSEPAETGNFPGRASDDRNQNVPDPIVVCCSWGFQGGTDNNKSFAGWYNPQTTVRLKVKDKALMDQMIKAAQDYVAMEVQLSGGNTITGFKVMSEE